VALGIWPPDSLGYYALSYRLLLHQLGKLRISYNMGMGQNLVPLVNIKIAGKWMFIPLKMYL